MPGTVPSSFARPLAKRTDRTYKLVQTLNNSKVVNKVYFRFV